MPGILSSQEAEWQEVEGIYPREGDFCTSDNEVPQGIYLTSVGGICALMISTGNETHSHLPQ